MIEDVPEETLRGERQDLAKQLDALRGAKRRFKEDAKAGADRSIALAQARVDDLLSDAVYRLSRLNGDPIAAITGLADALALTDPAVVARLHAAIDATPGSNRAGATFGPFTRAEYETAKRSLEAEIRTRERELARRIEVRRHEAEMARLEEAPEAILAAAERALEPGEPGYGEQVHIHSARQTEVTHA